MILYRERKGMTVMNTMPIKKQAQSTFNVPKYKKIISELIMEVYHVDKLTAMAAISRSGLEDSLRVSPELTSHIPDEDWADKIWAGYIKTMKDDI